MATVSILKKTTITPSVATAFNNLLRQVRRDTNINVSTAQWRRIVRQDNFRIFVVYGPRRSQIVGMAILRWHELPGRKTAFLDDLVVDEKHRGKGLGTKLLTSITAWAKSHDIDRIDFTSGHDRTSAHWLYQKFGWQRRNTKVYRLML